MEQLTRTIIEHHDGHGLTESIVVEADAQDAKAGGASHVYACYMSGVLVSTIQFQHGARHVDGSTPGVVEGVLLAVLIDRLEGFQAGPYACQENADQLLCLRSALQLTKARADARAARGVLGRNEK